MAKMNYRILFIVFLLSISDALNAQDHLEPTSDIFSENRLAYEYYSEVRSRLLENLSPFPIAQLVIIPSFSNEVIWQIRHDKERNKYYSVTATGNHSIWYNRYQNKPKRIKAEVRTAEINEETGELIKRLFRTAVNTVRYPDRDGFWGADGTNYYFSSSDRSGTIWSPNEESKMYRLVNICQKLMERTFQKKELTQEMASDIERLISDLK